MMLEGSVSRKRCAVVIDSRFAPKIAIFKLIPPFDFRQQYRVRKPGRRGYRAHSEYTTVLSRQPITPAEKERRQGKEPHKRRNQSSDHHRPRRCGLPVEARHCHIKCPCKTAPPLYFHWKEISRDDYDRNANSNLILIDNRIIQSKENNRS